MVSDFDDPMSREKIIGLQERLEELNRKLAARAGIAEYKENVKALKIEIARIEALIAE